VRYRGTTFFWHTERPGDGPSEGDSPGESRVSAPVDVVPGTADARAQARADVLGWNRLVVVNDPAGHAVYVSRQTPMQYPQGRTPPGAPTPNLGELYAASLTNGFGLGPATPDPGEVQGVNYPQYRYTLTFQQRRYFVRTDAQMLAQAPPAGSGLTPSPLAPGNATYQVTLGTPTAGTPPCSGAAAPPPYRRPCPRCPAWPATSASRATPAARTRWFSAAGWRSRP
jgi:hypothetical protein